MLVFVIGQKFLLLLLLASRRPLLRCAFLAGLLKQSAIALAGPNMPSLIALCYFADICSVGNVSMSDLFYLFLEVFSFKYFQFWESARVRV
jgi:hypothetical protein